jgi:hypothetical protein
VVDGHLAGNPQQVRGKRSLGVEAPAHRRREGLRKASWITSSMSSATPDLSAPIGSVPRHMMARAARITSPTWAR